MLSVTTTLFGVSFFCEENNLGLAGIDLDMYPPCSDVLNYTYKYMHVIKKLFLLVRQLEFLQSSWMKG